VAMNETASVNALHKSTGDYHKTFNNEKN
jgi:hypothetical protein